VTAAPRLPRCMCVRGVDQFSVSRAMLCFLFTLEFQSQRTGTRALMALNSGKLEALLCACLCVCVCMKVI